MANLREFRHSISVLKKQGLIPKTVDARSAIPDKKVRGKKLSTLVRKYDAITSGKATAIKVTPAELRKYRRTGFETSQGRVIIPHSATEKATVKSGNIVLKSANGIERVQIPVEFHNLKQWLTDLKKNARRINAMKKDNEYFGIRFFGGQRANFYADINSLIADLSRYESVQSANSKRKQSEVYQNLEILRFNYSTARRLETEIGERARSRSKQANRRYAKTFRKKLKRKPAHIRVLYQEATARRMREYRARLKKDKRQYSKYKRNAKKRAAKSAKKFKAIKRKRK